jgi:hypothetical protein
MPHPVSSIRNIGPATEQAFARIGIESAEAVRDMGPDAAYAALVEAGERPHFIGYYALVMGLQGRPWNDCQGAEKTALRQRFDSLVAQAKSPPLAGIERALDEIGIRLRN